MVWCQRANNFTYKNRRIPWPNSCSKRFADDFKGKGDTSSMLPKQAQFWKILYAISSDTKQEYDASRELRSGKHDNETVTLLYRLANHMEQPWRSKARARLRRVLTFRNATVPKFNLPLKIPFLAHSAFKNNVQKWVSKLIRQHRHVLIPYHLPTKTVQELPHPALNKVLWNHMCKVTAQGRHWEREPCKCHEFLLEHPRAEQHEGHVATGLEALDFCKGQSNLGAAFANVGACNAFFPSKQRLHDQVLDQLRRWLKHHLFPNDDRILESFEAFFEEQWQQHKEQQRHEPRLTHRLIKHLTSALPDNYIIHKEDRANAHLMIYCPNIYNQAAFNTWMDEKTFLLLDKTPEDIKEDMERQTPPVVRKHYKRLLDYNKPIPYGYIMMKHKKQWNKGRTIIAYSNTCVERLLRIAALALQQMLKATWPHHFGNIATPQLWQEVHELFQANEEQPERELIFLNHDLVGFFNSILQADIIQSVRYLLDASNDDYNHSIRVKSMALVDAHSLACDMAIQHTEITAYSLLEVTFDLRMLVALAQTNKAVWLRCSQVLSSTSTECKILSNAPWHKRAGRAVAGNDAETPIDIKMYLFNKRMHTWYHHELSYQQYMDLEVREHANQAVQSAMDAIVQQHPQAHHTTVIRDNRESSSGYYGSTSNTWSFLLALQERVLSTVEVSQADILSLRVGEYYWSKINNQWQRVWFPVTRAWLFERERKDRNCYARDGSIQFIVYYEEEEAKPYSIEWMSYATIWIHLAN
ncbi:unnamed protein product [Symbiodinium necroappetens]|uniref:Uncharacterized protein n=1 Tax=Symbiodinium necroappetens TaxID=1628268 RepID=A0A812YD31_9DINO|nr:unnamed protein product [Symbiodinium necroappetens]